MWHVSLTVFVWLQLKKSNFLLAIEKIRFCYVYQHVYFCQCFQTRNLSQFHKEIVCH